MRIQHNIMAMSAYRNYTNNVAAMKKNLEKLSSGYKINRAGDDAAGLAISEKMRAQITGLETAQKNAKDGISLVQTAEGALTEVHDMLNRMVELATQSANGTYENTTDRAQLQKEVDQLKSEINRIADSSNFNGIKLLDGSMDGTVTSTTTEYTSGKNNVPILQDIAMNPTEEVGTKTVLHVDGAKDDKKTSFKVELHSVNMSGKDGDKVSIKIGEKTLNFTFDKNVTGNTAIAGKLEPGSVSADDLASAIKKQWDESTKILGGQEFNVTASNGTLTFTQAATPTNINELVDPFKDVTITFAGGATETKYATKLDAAQQKALIDSDKIILDGNEYDFAITNTGDSLTQTFGDYTVKYDNGKLEITSKSGAASAPSISIASKTGAVTNSSSQDDGVIAATASVTSVVIGGATLTSALGGTKISFFDSEGNLDKTVDLTSAAGGTSFAVTIGGVGYTMTVNAAGTTFSLAAHEAGAAGNRDIGFKVSQAMTAGGTYESVGGGAISIAGGADAQGAKAHFAIGATGVSAGNTIEFNGKKFTVKTNVEDTLKELADWVNASTFQDLYKVTADGATLTVESKTVTSGTSVGATVAIKTGGVDEQDIGNFEEIKASSGKDGTWNIKTTENIQGAVSGPGVLASTTFKLNSGIVKDENTLTIGNKTFTFKVGKSSTATAEDGGEVIDLSDLEEGDANLVEEAAKRLSEKTTEVFTIGYDETKPGVISIHEKANQSVYTNGELSELGSFDELVYFNSKKDESVTETTTAGGKSLTLQIGDTAEKFNQLVVNVKDMHADAMGIGDVNIGNQEDAAKAVDLIKAAINYVSDVRGTLGATQNRLDHTINNLSVMTENIQDAESTIRDTDVADEMMAYTKNNILIQSAQAMLAQANQVPQGVLQLLQ